MTPFELYYNKGKDYTSCFASVVEAKYELAAFEDPSIVREFDLSQNYPNPFNSSTTIKYFIRKAGSVKISVFDILGNRAAVIVDKFKPAGSYYVKFDGSRLPSGVYIYKMESEGYTSSKKLILLK
jgi:hypothetical protein